MNLKGRLETKSDSDEDDELVLEGIVLEDDNEEKREKSVRCRCYVGCFALWALIVYLLSDYYLRKISLRM